MKNYMKLHQNVYRTKQVKDEILSSDNSHPLLIESRLPFHVLAYGKIKN